MYPPDFWGQLGAAEHEALIAVARSRIFPAGSVLCTEGEPTTHVFVLLSGWVKCITVTQDGREILEALRSEGDVIGEIAGQITGYRTATVQAVGAVNALIAGTKQFGDFLDAHPAAARVYRRYVAERHHAANEQQRAHVLSSGGRRLACLLLDLAEQQDRADDGAFTAPPPLSQEELASLIGASRSTVTRALRDWRSRHIIGTDPRNIEILDRARLLRIAGRTQQGSLSPRGSPLSARTRRRNEDHSHGENSSIVSDGLRESRTSTVCSSLAISTQLGPSALALLVRQFSVECRLCRPSIQHPSFRRGDRHRAAPRDVGVDTAGANEATPPAHVDIPQKESRRFRFCRLSRYAENLTSRYRRVHLLRPTGPG